MNELLIFQKALAEGRLTPVQKREFLRLYRSGALGKPPEPRGAVENAAAAVNRGVLETAGLPGDALNAGLSVLGLGPLPVGTDALVGAGEAVFGPGAATPDPGRASTSVGRVAGQAATLGTGVASGAVRATLSSVTPQIVREAAQAPGRFIGTETAIGAAAGAGEAKLKDNPLLGNIIGATAAGGVLAATKAAVQALRVQFSSTETRTARALQNVATDPKGAARRMVEDPPIQAPFTSTQLSNDTGLLWLEKQLLTGPRSRELMVNRNELDRAIQDQIRALAGKGVTSDFVNSVRTHSSRLMALADARVAQAVRQAEDAAQELPKAPGYQEAASRMFVENLDSAIRDIRVQESQKWSDALGGTVPGTVLQQAVYKVFSSMMKADKPLPGWLGQLADDFAKGETVSVEEIQAVRSRLLQDIRAENAGDAPDRRVVALLRSVDDEILESLRAAGGEAFDDARTFSRQVQERYFKGPIGELMGFEATGIKAIPPNEALRSLLQGREAGGTAADAILKAAQGDAVILGSVTGYVRAEFVRQTFEGGKVKPSAASHFLSKHAEFLERFPALQQQLTAIKSRQDVADLMIADQKVTQKELNAARTSLFIEGNPTDRINQVLNLSDSRFAMKEMIDQVQSDPKAVDGLKALVTEGLINRFKGNIANNMTGDFIIADVRARKFLDAKTDTLSMLFNKQEMERLKDIHSAIDIAFRAINNKANIKGSDTRELLEGTRQSTFLVGLLGRVVGAGVFAKFGIGVGKLQSAQLGSKAVRDLLTGLGADEMQALVFDAIKNPETMRTLLMRPLPENQTIIKRRLRAHLASLGFREDES